MRRRWKWVVGGLGVVALLAYVIAFLADEPLRRMLEREINARLKGYTMRIERLDFHPIPLSVDLRDVIVLQDAYPERPIIRLPRLSASVKWGAVVRGRVAADVQLDSPDVHVDRAQLARELQDPIPVEKKGWQEALQAIHPLKINEFVVRNASLTYVETDRTRPLTVRRIEIVANEISTVPSTADVYPSPVRMTGVVFDNGWLALQGHADLLRVPHVGFKGHLELNRIALAHFTGITAGHGLAVTAGTLAANGRVEYAPHIKIVDLVEMSIDGLEGNYTHHERTAKPAKDAAKAVAEKAKEVANQPGVLLKVRRLRLHDATVGFINEQVSPRYRVFLTKTNLIFENFSNRLTEGTGTTRLTGLFMGSGATTISATFRPETKGADFDLEARIEGTDLKTMNDLLRAHAKVDVVSGSLSVFAEARVKSGRVDGYVKPLFRDIRLYGAEQDDEKSMGQKFKERTADVIAKVMRNKPRAEVATVVPLAGPLDNPKASTWEALIGLVRNAFSRAILPGLERERFGFKR